MATTRINHVGRVRTKLAEILEKSIPGFHIFPDELASQIPVYASPHWDCCSWYGDGTIEINVEGTTVKAPCHVFSYDTMRECLKGIQASSDGHLEFEISAVDGGGTKPATADVAAQDPRQAAS